MLHMNQAENKQTKRKQSNYKEKESPLNLQTCLCCPKMLPSPALGQGATEGCDTCQKNRDSSLNTGQENCDSFESKEVDRSL